MLSLRAIFDDMYLHSEELVLIALRPLSNDISLVKVLKRFFKQTDLLESTHGRIVSFAS